MATTPNSSPAKSSRAPAVTIALAVAAGLCASRSSPGHFERWWLVAAGFCAAWIILSALGRGRLATVMLLAGWLSLAAAWHDALWTWVSPRDVSRLATDDGVVVRLVAKVAEPAWIVATSSDDSAPFWQTPERTLTTCDCRELAVDSKTLPVTGQVRLSLVGHYPELTCGDVIRVVGKLRLPPAPLNPGDFDYRTWLKSHGVRAILHVESAECIRPMTRESSLADLWGRFRHSLRQEARVLFLSMLSPETAGVAETLLLGGRRRLDDDLRQAFVDSGMLHVLAISGMNVALLGLWLTILCRLAGCSSRRSLWLTVIGLVAYAAVTDGDPPVVRATVMALLGAAALLSGRQTGAVQVVAVSLLGMMIVRPSDLFDTGAQLSFLSVLTLSRTLSAWQHHRRQQAAAGLSLVPIESRGTWMRQSLRLWQECCLVSFGIWLATTPLVAWRFQLISPIGLILNVVLSPLIVVLMWAGYSFLIVGLLAPVAALPLALLFDACLTWLIRSVSWASALPLGHIETASPPAWWMAGYYAGVFALLLWGSSSRTRALAVRGVLIWLILGLSIGLLPKGNRGMSCQFLAVGHGLSVLLELPNGKTLLYDAGSMGDPRRTERLISNELRRRGHRRIDAVILSHADADHINAMPNLMRRIPIGGVFIGPGFLSEESSLPAEIVERCARKKISVGLLAAGHRISLDPDVEIRILHPSESFYSDKDNPFSLVTAVEYRGRRILLTGDLEGDGLAELLRNAPCDCDVLLSPHHGSRAANPARLARWSTPEWVVISTRDAHSEGKLATCYASSSRLLATAQRGAIEFRISPRGEMHVETFRGGDVGESIHLGLGRQN